MARRKKSGKFASNGIIQGDAFSPLLFFLIIDPLVKILKRACCENIEVLYYMDDLKVSMDNIESARKVHEIVRKYAASVGMVINEKSAIQLNVQTPLPESLQDIPRLDVTTYKYLGFEMKKGEVDKKRDGEKTRGTNQGEIEGADPKSWNI